MRVARPEALEDPVSAIAEYTYLGLRNREPLVVDYPEPDVRMTAALDRFARFEEMQWVLNPDTTPSTLDHTSYGFNLAGNRIWQQNHESAGKDQWFTYDGAGRLTKRERGTLVGDPPSSITSIQYTEDFALDKLGNWDEYDYDGTAQTRSHNDGNQLTGVVQGGNTSAPTYDGAGNMTAYPDIGTTSTKYDLVYDAWNRLVKVTETGSSVVGQYEYDGLHRRVVKKYGSGLSATRYFLYSANWQMLEERLTASGNPDKRYAWGVRYLDDLVLRLGMPSADDRIYALHDYYHVVALVEKDDVSSAWDVVQRYRYSAYGNVTVMDVSWNATTDSYDWAYTYGAYYQDVADSTDTGFFQCRFRYYTSELGRWLTRDPIGERGGINLYEYVESDPINHCDFMGLLKWKIKESKCTITMIAKIDIEWEQDSLWTEDRKKRFKKLLKKQIEDTFNNSSIRIYASPYLRMFIVYGSGGRNKGELCYCACKMWKPQLNIEYGNWGEDWNAHVWPNESGEWIWSSANVGTGPATLDEADVLKDYKGIHEGVSASQYEGVHEFGHLIGLPHPDPSKGNEREAYTADWPSLMGGGMEMRTHYFQKWADILDETYPQCAKHRVDPW